ncbi:MAG: M20/M25/M40 family metallo-hydrolase [Pirellulales bacterium]|nr:M20/M25/M40 family metallo-hydrolase [Pirellulales bacterium]
MTRIHTTKPLPAALSLFLLAALFNIAPIAGQQIRRDEPDWSQAREEAVQILSGMIKIDTSNPPGNETKVAQYLKAILDREVVPSEIVEMEPGRGNLVARLRGNGKKRPILLMGHTDVVGVERDKWTVDPFGGIMKDGYVYGRGASDNKGNVAAYLQVLLLLHRRKVPLQRDVIFVAQAGEESASKAGIRCLVAQHWDKIACEFALDEGGVIFSRDGKVQYVGIAATEKVPRGIRLVARGKPGHGSVPRPDNAITHLAAAVAKVGTYQPPMRLNDTTRTFFARLATVSPPDEARLFEQLEDPVQTLAAQDKIRAMNLVFDSMMRTSISPTIIQGGFRSNVIPAEAEATLDVRALPDEDIPALVETLRKLIDDPAVEVIGPSSGRSSVPPSSAASEMFLALEHAQAAVFPGAVTLPLLLTGATDMAPLRAKGVQAYGLGNLKTIEDMGRVHGNDERASVDGLGKFIELVYRAVTEIAADP